MLPSLIFEEFLEQFWRLKGVVFKQAKTHQKPTKEFHFLQALMA